MSRLACGEIATGVRATPPGNSFTVHTSGSATGFFKSLVRLAD
jgi:hypothetical protein